MLVTEFSLRIGHARCDAVTDAVYSNCVRLKPKKFMGGKIRVSGE
jgi:hypothetical protein